VYDIQLLKKGFKPLISQMKVRPGQLNHKSFKLKKKRPPKREGLIIVYSHPENAKIFIQNRKMGQTPRKFSFPEGSYTIEIRKKGYQPYKKQVHITPWKTLYVNAGLEKKSIQRKNGDVHISSSPKGAKIMVDGKYYGRSPMSLGLVPGKHYIKITKRGFQTYEQRIRIKPFQSHYINAALVRVVPVKNYNGKINVVSKPLGSKVFINGAYQGKTPLEFKLPADIYTLEIRHKGYRNYKQQIKIKPGKRLHIKTSLHWEGYKHPIGDLMQVIDDISDLIKQ
ncbi:MAG: PEGA domain-containing protein, partial [Desulfobacteraceae bacterium]|nr:PEGA domain-containing protein [Desulfobacteraceae bacterium]